MDRRTLLAFLLIFIVFVTFQVANSKFFPPDEIAAAPVEVSHGGTHAFHPVLGMDEKTLIERTNGAIVSELARQGLVDRPGASEMR